MAGNEQQDQGGAVQRWCILTTAATRTLPLARALTNAGVVAWTPARMERRVGRGKQRDKVVQVEVAITPTFVFADATRVDDLLRSLALPVSPYPAFRIMRHGDRIPLVSNAGLASLRAAEERFAASLLKTTRRKVAIGTTVRMSKGAFAGMTGVVEGGTDKEAKVNFGSGFVVSIASYLLGTDVVQAKPQPITGIAA
jgi:hypothetical protein